MTILDNPIVQFIIGGTILSGGTYLANFSHPLIAILLVSFPLELITVYLIRNNKRREKFTYSWLIFLLISICATGFLYFSLPIKSISFNFKLLITLFIMCILLLLSYFLKKH